MLHLNNKQKDKQEVRVNQQQKKEKFKFVGSLHPKPNQRCFEIDLDTFVVKESDYFYKTDTITWHQATSNKRIPNNRGVVVKMNHDYVIKLNLDNAVKYFKVKYGNQVK